MSDTYKNSRNGRHARETWKYSFSVSSSSFNSHRIGWEHLEKRRSGQREAASRRVFLNLEAEHGAVLNRLSCGFPSHLEWKQSLQMPFEICTPPQPLWFHILPPPPPLGSLPLPALATFFSLSLLLKHVNHPFCLGDFASAAAFAWTLSS